MQIPPPSWKDSFADTAGVKYGAVEPGRAEADLEVQAHHCNPNGVCHGGALFTLADDSMGAALHPLSPQGHAPISTQVGIHYLRSARPGDRLHVVTEVLSHGRRTAMVQSRVTDSDGKLVALVTASYLFVEIRG